MSKITLNQVASLQNETTALSVLNNNFTTLQTAFDNTLSRDGTQPNTMQNILDMNSYDIINLPAPTNLDSPMRLTDFQTLKNGGNIVASPLPVGGASGQVLAKNSSTNYDVSWQTVSGTGISTTDFPTRATAIAALVPSNINSIRITGYLVAADGGGGVYIKLASAPSQVRTYHFQSFDGAWWQLNTNAVFPKQCGAHLDAVADDTVALQAWLDYGATFNVPCLGQAGTAYVAANQLNLSSNQIVDGMNCMTIQRGSNNPLSLIDGTNINNVIVRNLNLNTTAGFSSSTSNTIAATSMNFSVPSGLTGLVVGNFVQITANTTTASRVNYMIAQITSYSGTILGVTCTTVGGSGTFNSWFIDSYPLNGDLAQSPCAIKFTTCNNIVMDNNVVSGRFYNAYDARNCSDVVVTNNEGNGYVNRGIHVSAYLAGGSCINALISGNHLLGNSFSQYGINCSASDGATAAGINIVNNRIENTNFQGIIVAGGITHSHVSNNSVQLSFATNGAGIILESLVGSTGNQAPQNNTFTGNTVVLGSQGFFVTNTFYNSFTGNVCTANNIGFFFSGSASNQTLYNTLSGNVAQGTTSHGFYFSGSSASGVSGSVVVGNSSVGCGGYGFFSDGNTSNSNYSANASIANTLGGYSLSGTGNVINGTNL